MIYPAICQIGTFVISFFIRTGKIFDEGTFKCSVHDRFIVVAEYIGTSIDQFVDDAGSQKSNPFVFVGYDFKGTGNDF